jgi:hypothetical protein
MGDLGMASVENLRDRLGLPPLWATQEVDAAMREYERCAALSEDERAKVRAASIAFIVKRAAQLDHDPRDATFAVCEATDRAINARDLRAMG